MTTIKLIVILGACFVCLSLFCHLQVHSNSVVSKLDHELIHDLQRQPDQNARSKFKLSGLFSFDKFKEVFRRVYGSIVEEMARKRLYLARAMQVFSSAVKYKYFLRTSYLAINRMSDWTPVEIKRLYHDGSPILKQQEVSQKNDYAAQADDLQDPSKRIEELKFKEPHRTKRNTDEELRDLKLDNLFKEPKIEQNMISEEIPSNNPHYLAPTKTSSDSEQSRDDRTNPMPTDIAQKVISLPLINLVRDFLTNGWNKYQSQLQPCNQTEPVATSNIVEPNGASGETVTEDNNQLIPTKHLPNEVFIDLRESNCFSPAKNQGVCGSCYAFATIAMYEWLLCKQTGHRVTLSEQYIIDCANGAFDGMSGCGGGNILRVPDFVHYFGLELQENYPYKGITNRCAYKPDEVPSNLEKMGYLKLNKQNNLTPVHLSIVPEILRERPINFDLAVNEEFFMYGGGVDMNLDCVVTNFHSMLLIGSGREDGVEYFLFRNSHGPGWGEEGYYKMDSQSLCINAYGYAIIADFEPEFFDSINEKYDAEKIKLHHTNNGTESQQETTNM